MSEVPRLEEGVPPVDQRGESPHRPVGVSWEELLEFLVFAKEVLSRLRAELGPLCRSLDCDFATIRDRRGKGMELRVCKRDEWGRVKCRYYYLSRKRREQLERLGLDPTSLLRDIRDLCRLLGFEQVDDGYAESTHKQSALAIRRPIR